jgi:hypothetical protein
MITLQMGEGFPATLATLSSLGRNVFAAVSSGLEKGVRIVAGRVSSDYLSGQSLKVRGGMLRKSLDGWLDSPIDAVVGIPAGSAVDSYKWLLGNETKTILPRKGKFLTIPIGENLSGSGVPRYTSPRQVQGGFFVKTKGRLLFGFKNGKKGKFRPLFTLVKSVTIQGSGALSDGVFDNLDKITGSIQAEVDRMII